ncbi:MAG: BREX system ATP-binding domain-containing protein, partial [Acidimicrobiales bacterium]
DWDGLATNAVRRALAATAHAVPEGSDDVSVGAVAAVYGVDAGELSRDVNRQLQQDVQRDYAMIGEFRTAMLRLCQAQLRTGQVTDAEHAAVLDWLTGDLRQISVLRSAMIFRRIGRHNGRQMLFSLSHWLSTNGIAGLVLELDIRRLGFARRPRPEERSGVYYTRAALLDAYELLRQLVDNTDELSNCCVVVMAGPELIADANRGLDAYQALKLRILDDVRDRNRDNPYSSLVRLGGEAA